VLTIDQASRRRAEHEDPSVAGPPSGGAVEEQEVRQGGIIIPDTAKEKPQEGRVVAAGVGKVNDEGKRLTLDVKVGDRILFAK
jgi:hypothetical protein